MYLSSRSAFTQQRYLGTAFSSRSITLFSLWVSPLSCPPSRLHAECSEGTRRLDTPAPALPKSRHKQQKWAIWRQSCSPRRREGDAPWLAASNPPAGCFHDEKTLPGLDGDLRGQDPRRLQWLSLNFCLPWAESELTASTELITCPQTLLGILSTSHPLGQPQQQLCAPLAHAVLRWHWVGSMQNIQGNARCPREDAPLHMGGDGFL